MYPHVSGNASFLCNQSQMWVAYNVPFEMSVKHSVHLHLPTLETRMLISGLCVMLGTGEWTIQPTDDSH